MSRNLLTGEAVVASFGTHGGLAGSSQKSAPLVTISSFGDKGSSLRGGAKPMASSLRSSNRSMGAGGSGHTAWFGGVRPIEQEMKIKKEAGGHPEEKKAEAQVSKESQEPEEKFTSFCDPTPADAQVEECVTSFTSQGPAEESPVSATPTETTPTETTPTGATPPATHASDPSKRSSTLSRKAPVFKEKPHVPIKPQSDLPDSKLPESRKKSPSSSPPLSSASSVRLNKSDFILGPADINSATDNCVETPQPQSLDSSPPSSAQSGKLNKPPTPFKVGGSRRLSAQDSTVDSAGPQQPQNGGFNVRFVHSSSAGSSTYKFTPELKSPASKSPELRSPQLKSPDLRAPELKSPDLKPEYKTPELRSPGLKPVGLRPIGLKPTGLRPTGFKASSLTPLEFKLPELKTSVSKLPESKSPQPPSPDPKPPKSPESNAITRLDQLSTPSSPEANQEADATNAPESEKITRTSFELARANLAGSLELTRLGPSAGSPAGSPLRQESSAPKPDADPEPSAKNSDPEFSQGESGEDDDDDDDDDEFLPSPVIPGESVVETVNLFAINKRRSSENGSGSDVIPVKPQGRSSSAQGRMPVVSLTPGECGGSREDVRMHLRSSSVTSRHGDLIADVAPSKTPSIRKIIRQTASQLRQLAETGTRLSRSDRFAMEGGSRKNLAGLNSSSNNKTRFGKSIRKLLGMKKDSGPLKSGFDSSLDADGVLANVQQKSRPEIVHPLDFHPPGQVTIQKRG